MGFVVVLLTARAGAYDLLADPLGWVLVLVGLRALPPGVEHQPALRALALAALVVSVLTWVPAVLDRVDDDSLRWAASLPQLGFVALLAHALMTAAGATGDRRSARWWSGVRTLVLVVAVLPVLVLGGHVSALRDLTGALTVIAPVVVIALLFAHGSRPWALDPDRQAAPAS